MGEFKCSDYSFLMRRLGRSKSQMTSLEYAEVVVSELNKLAAARKTPWSCVAVTMMQKELGMVAVFDCPKTKLTIIT